MKKIIIAVMSVLIFTLTACGTGNEKDKISEEIGIDISDGGIVYDNDTHSGNGDGTKCVIFEFDNDEVFDKIENNANWNKLPFDETVETLVYGISNENESIGPYLTDEDGNSMIPKIENGYYFFKDGQADKDKEILDRYSFNFTVAVYDNDNNKMYFCELDT